MNLQAILNHRRAVRDFDANQPLDTEKVKNCLRMASLAPSSSNMQLWEAVHVTDKAVIAQLAHASFDQSTVSTAQQVVIFVTRQDKYSQRAKANLAFERENIKRNSPNDRQASRIKVQETYYGKVMPFFYARCFGLLGLFRKLLAQSIGLFRPMMRQVSESDVRVSVHKSCALVVQTFMLAMSEVGYDTCPVEGFDSARVKKTLGLPCGTEVNMIITCGVRTDNGVHGDRFRVPFEEVYRRM